MTEKGEAAEWSARDTGQKERAEPASMLRKISRQEGKNEPQERRVKIDNAMLGDMRQLESLQLTFIRHLLFAQNDVKCFMCIILLGLTTTF